MPTSDKECENEGQIEPFGSARLDAFPSFPGRYTARWRPDAHVTANEALVWVLAPLRWNPQMENRPCPDAELVQISDEGDAPVKLERGRKRSSACRMGKGHLAPFTVATPTIRVVTNRPRDLGQHSLGLPPSSCVGWKRSKGRRSPAAQIGVVTICAGALPDNSPTRTSAKHGPEPACEQSSPERSACNPFHVNLSGNAPTAGAPTPIGHDPSPTHDPSRSSPFAAN